MRWRWRRGHVLHRSSRCAPPPSRARIPVRWTGSRWSNTPFPSSRARCESYFPRRRGGSGSVGRRALRQQRRKTRRRLRRDAWITASHATSFTVQLESAGRVSDSTAMEAALKTRNIVPLASGMQDGTPMRFLCAVVAAPAQVCFLMNPLVVLTNALCVTAKKMSGPTICSDSRAKCVGHFTQCGSTPTRPHKASYHRNTTARQAVSFLLNSGASKQKAEQPCLTATTELVRHDCECQHRPRIRFSREGTWPFVTQPLTCLLLLLFSRCGA